MSGLFDELRWHKIDSTDDDGFEGPLTTIDLSINNRIYLFQGDFYKIPFDAVIVGENEMVTDRVESGPLFALAGPETENEVAGNLPIQTGSSVICYGGNLCPFIILSVGPKYDEKYITASTHALYTAYKTALLLAAQQPDIKTLAVCPIYLHSSKYPREAAAHLALRVIRRFLEHSISHSFEKVVLCLPEEDFNLYQLYMQAYFPRTRDEANGQIDIIPGDMGDEWGNIAIASRQVKITVGPKPVEGLVPTPIPLPPNTDKTEGPHRRLSLSGDNIFPPTWPAPRSMTAAVGDVDAQRIKKINHELAKMTREDRLRSRFNILAAETADEDFSDVASWNLLDIIGTDRRGRTVVAVYAANISTVSRGMLLTEDLIERIQAFVIQKMDALSCVPFVVVYFCSGIEVESCPDSSWVSALLDVLLLRYAPNLQGSFMVHASFALRMYLFLGNGFSDFSVVDSLRSLNETIDVAAVNLPNFIKQIDKSLTNDNW